MSEMQQLGPNQQSWVNEIRTAYPSRPERENLASWLPMACLISFTEMSREGAESVRNWLLSWSELSGLAEAIEANPRNWFTAPK